MIKELKSQAKRQNLSIFDIDLRLNGVARTLKKLRTSKGAYWIKQPFSSIASLFKMRTSLKGKNLLPDGANYDMINHLYHIGCPPLKVTIFITHERSCVMGATPMTPVFKYIHI